MFFVFSSVLLLILVTLFSIGTVKVMYFQVFSPKQVNSSASSFLIKCHDK